MSPVPDGLSGFVTPERDVDTAYFWDGVDAGELRLRSCTSCGRITAVPVPSCPFCASTEAHYPVAGGGGKLYSWVICHRAMEETFADDVPYVIADIKLDEGARIYGRLIDRAEVELIDGLPVEIVFVQMGPEKIPYWAFRPARA